MGKFYDPCDFIFNLKNVDLRDVSSDTVYFLKNGISYITATVHVDLNSEIVYISPNALIEELVEYKIVFSDKLRFANGRRFSKSFCMRFRVKKGAAYSPNSIGSDPDYFSSKNRLFFSLLMSVYFDDSINASEDLSFEMTELNESENDNTTGFLSKMRQSVTSRIHPLVLLSCVLFVGVVVLYIFC